MKIRKNNRLRSKRPKKRLFWCGCDRNMISPGEKCPVCGVIGGGNKRKFKKDVDIDKEEMI